MAKRMNATEHLSEALALGLINHTDVHERWIDLMHRMTRWGVASLIAAASNSRLDLLLRQLEAETRDFINHPNGQREPEFAFDFMLGLTENWVLRSYEIIRAAYEQSKIMGEPHDKLRALRDRFALVRMPIAKAEITAAGRHKQEIILATVEDGGDPRAYANDGSYVIPRGVCTETGAVMWWPVDLKTSTTVEICRRELSDEFLSVLD